MQIKNVATYLVVALMLPGCTGNKKYPHNAEDPFQAINRVTFTANKTLDQLYLRPMAVTYNTVVPASARTVVGNFIQNLAEIPNVANGLLQGKWQQAFKDTGRFMLNTTIGVLGMFDVAARLDLPRHKTDFGQTLASWGYKNSAYLVLPLLGPSTVRDGAALPVNTLMTVPYHFKPKWRNRYFAGTMLHKRSELLDSEEVINAAAVDEYTLIRDAYLQNRNFLINPETNRENDLSLDEPPE